jgi:nucleotide-binding universal stress UspA family protein
MTRTFKKVLCPIDFSTDAFTALDYAADFTRQNDGRLILLHVVDNPLTDLYGPRGANFYAEVEHAMEKSQEMLADAARAQTVEERSLLLEEAQRFERVVELALEARGEQLREIARPRDRRIEFLGGVIGHPVDVSGAVLPQCVRTRGHRTVIRNCDNVRRCAQNR